MHNENWDDLRYVLAVVNAGTVSGAARELSVNHATVLRRIAAFEDRHQISLFEKTAQGYNVPPDRQRIVDALKEVSEAMQSVDRVVQGTLAPLTGVIRITSTDSLCQSVLPPILSELTTDTDQLRVQLICSNAHLDMARLQADIAVRPAPRLPEDLFGEVVGHLGFAVYEGLAGSDRWIGMAGALERSPAAQWQANMVGDELISHASDSFLVSKELAITGQGKAILPCVIADEDPRLKRCPDLMPEISVPIWVASHVDLADSPRLRTLRTRLARALRADAATLTGQSGPAGSLPSEAIRANR